MNFKQLKSNQMFKVLHVLIPILLCPTGIQPRPMCYEASVV